MLRKLLLRGYTVKVMSRDESKEFPKSVIVVKGDVGDYQQVRDAVQGVDKVRAALVPWRSHGTHQLNGREGPSG